MMKLSIHYSRFETNFSSCTIEAVKVYVAAVEALRKKERQDETQFTTKIDANILFCRFF
jgi:hypothetical protein